MSQMFSVEQEYAHRLAHLAKMEPEDMLEELLAVLHGDGGHYSDTHGLAKAVADAEVKWLCRESLSDEQLDNVITAEFGVTYREHPRLMSMHRRFARSILAAASTSP